MRGRHTQVISTRKRLVGGFYAYENHDQVKDLGSLCSGTSDERGLLLCEADIQRAGQVELIVEAKDGAGQIGRAATSIWISGRDELWFAQDNDDRIDVLAEKLRYEPGETARLQVRMPFREATALVAVEREGVMDTRVVTLRGDDPTHRGADRGGLGSERLCQRAGAARTDPRGAVVFAVHLGLARADQLGARLLVRRAAVPGTDRDGRPGQADASSSAWRR